MEQYFASPRIGEPWTSVLKQRGITEPTPIQRELIPLLLEGGDAIAESRTGTGKTLAYLLPLLCGIDTASMSLQGLIVAPTRELGMQIFREIELFKEVSGIRAQSLIGGAALNRQIDKLKQHPHVVVGTPGRILELARLRKLKLQTVRTVVVDEADAVFGLGSAVEAEQLLNSLNRERQTVFVSATIPPSLEQTALGFTRTPAVIRADMGRRVPPQLEHVSIVCEERDKIDMLRKLIRHYSPTAALVFVNQTEKLAEIAAKLQHSGLEAEALYADAGKQDRARLLARFREGKLKLLAATDVAARGLDVPGISHIFHFDPATNTDAYVHRTGRTARMGAAGTAVSLITAKEQFILAKFEKELDIRIVPKELRYGELKDAGKGKARPGGKGAAPEERGNAVRRTAGTRPSGGHSVASEPAGSGPSAQAHPRSSRAASAAAGAGPGAGASESRSGRESRKKAGAAVQPAGKKRGAAPDKDKGMPRWLKAKRGMTEDPRPDGGK